MNNKAHKMRKARRWGRYFNHYTQNPDVTVGGRAARKLILDGIFGHRYARPFLYVRRQEKA